MSPINNFKYALGPKYPPLIRWYPMVAYLHLSQRTQILYVFKIARALSNFKIVSCNHLKFFKFIEIKNLSNFYIEKIYSKHSKHANVF